MSEPGKAADPARLDELAAVTKEYAKYSEAVTGFAGALTGGWLLAAEWVRSVSPRPGEMLLAFAPLLWMVLALPARRYYQRHGRVVAEDPLRADEVAMSGRHKGMAVTVIVLQSLVGITRQLDSVRGPWEMLTVAAFAAMPVLAVRLVRANQDVMLVMIVGWLVAPNVPSGWELWYAVIRSALAIGLFLVGTLDHVHFRRLERRLAALKARA